MPRANLKQNAKPGGKQKVGRIGSLAPLFPLQSETRTSHVTDHHGLHSAQYLARPHGLSTVDEVNAAYEDEPHRFIQINKLCNHENLKILDDTDFMRALKMTFDQFEAEGVFKGNAHDIAQHRELELQTARLLLYQEMCKAGESYAALPPPTPPPPPPAAPAPPAAVEPTTSSSSSKKSSKSKRSDNNNNNNNNSAMPAAPPPTAETAASPTEQHPLNVFGEACQTAHVLKGELGRSNVIRNGRGEIEHISGSMFYACIDNRRELTQEELEAHELKEKGAGNNVPLRDVLKSQRADGKLVEQLTFPEDFNIDINAKALPGGPPLHWLVQMRVCDFDGMAMNDKRKMRAAQAAEAEAEAKARAEAGDVEMAHDADVLVNDDDVEMLDTPLTRNGHTASGDSNTSTSTIVMAPGQQQHLGSVERLVTCDISGEVNLSPANTKLQPAKYDIVHNFLSPANMAADATPAAAAAGVHPTPSASQRSSVSPASGTVVPAAAAVAVAAAVARTTTTKLSSVSPQKEVLDLSKKSNNSLQRDGGGRFVKNNKNDADDDDDSIDDADDDDDDDEEEDDSSSGSDFEQPKFYEDPNDRTGAADSEVAKFDAAAADAAAKKKNDNSNIITQSNAMPSTITNKKDEKKKAKSPKKSTVVDSAAAAPPLKKSTTTGSNSSDSSIACVDFNNVANKIIVDAVTTKLSTSCITSKPFFKQQPPPQQQASTSGDADKTATSTQQPKNITSTRPESAARKGGSKSPPQVATMPSKFFAQKKKNDSVQVPKATLSKTDAAKNRKSPVLPLSTVPAASAAAMPAAGPSTISSRNTSFDNNNTAARNSSRSSSGNVSGKTTTASAASPRLVSTTSRYKTPEGGKSSDGDKASPHSISSSSSSSSSYISLGKNSPLSSNDEIQVVEMVKPAAARRSTDAVPIAAATAAAAAVDDAATAGKKITEAKASSSAKPKPGVVKLVGSFANGALQVPKLSVAAVAAAVVIHNKYKPSDYSSSSSEEEIEILEEVNKTPSVVNSAQQLHAARVSGEFAAAKHPKQEPREKEDEGIEEIISNASSKQVQPKTKDEPNPTKAPTPAAAAAAATAPAAQKKTPPK